MRGFKGFLGGLDSERDLTGELSVYTKFQELEIMFHVSTLLPFSPKDSQQVFHYYLVASAARMITIRSGTGCFSVVRDALI